MNDTSKADIKDLERAAQCWCDPRTEKIAMIPELATVFAEALKAERMKVLELKEMKGLVRSVEFLINVYPCKAKVRPCDICDAKDGLDAFNRLRDSLK